MRKELPNKVVFRINTWGVNEIWVVVEEANE